MVRNLLTAAVAANMCWVMSCAIDAPGQAPPAGSPIDESQPEARPDYQRPDRLPVRPGQPAAAVAVREVRGGSLHKVDVPSLKSAESTDMRALLAAAKVELPGKLSSFEVADFDIVTHTTSKTLHGATLLHVTLQQKINGTPVDGTYLRLTSRMSDKRTPTRLLSSSFRLYPQPSVSTSAEINRADAIAKARPHLRAPERAPVLLGDLLIRKLHGQLQLVWDVALKGSDFRASVVANGPQLGRVFVEDTRVFQADGTATGNFVQNGAPGGNQGEILNEGLANLTINADSGASGTTDAAGNFSIADAIDGEPISARLSGTAANVFNISGADMTVDGIAGPNAALNFDAATEQEIAQVTAYVFTDATRTYLIENGVDPNVLGAPLTTNTNLPQTCNAFYSGFDRSINFFVSGQGCNNTAIDTVVAHEYGHFADDVFGGITNGGLSEGWGDLLACYLTEQPIVGEDFLQDGGIVRTCENDYQFPPSGNDAVHSLGQAWAGFAWRTRLGLIETYGPEEGDALARALILPNLGTNAPDIPEAVRETALRDDDDGDPETPSPNFAILLAAADHHALGFAVDVDLVPPGTVNDLQVIGTGATTVSVQWTATGDDGAEGQAAAYDLRFSTDPITADNFDLAAIAAAPVPDAAGTTQSADLTVPPGTTVFVALKVIDEQFNASAVSNVVEATTDEGVLVYAENVESGGADWTTTGLWHVTQRRASEGANSFWYGIEETGDYDNGAPNSGSLTSPVISLANADNPLLSFFEFIDVEEGDFFDLITLTVVNVDDPAQTVTFPKTTGNTGGGFAPRLLSLADFQGANIQLIFDFNTIDDIANNLEGWYIDDIRIVGEGDGGGGECDVCEPIDAPLDPNCDPCAGVVCEIDSFCCEVAWDATCVEEAVAFCEDVTCDGGPACGDGVCEGGETCDSCPVDCGPCGGDCNHDECEVGDALDPSCNECAAIVCEIDSFCCEVTWDEVCVQEAAEFCGTCDGGGDCAHDVCEEGEPLEIGCNDCATTVCEVDPFCCEVAWDALCVQEATDLCGECDGGGGTCEYDVCVPGPSPEADCDDECVQTVCEADPFCCDTFWDRLCVEEAEQLCNIECVTCAHDLCVAGEPLDPEVCDEDGLGCTAAVCDFDPFCCEVAWDSRCITEANLFCGLSCEECVHSPCEPGLPLEPSCDPCVAAVCEVDDFCCFGLWDDRCVEQAGDICGLTCDTFRSSN